MALPLFVLYGSATGNAEHIAKDLASRCQSSLSSSVAPNDYFSEVVCCELDQFKKKCVKIWDVPPPSTCKAFKYPVIVVTSTTGNGDPPENANRFVRFLKRKTTPTTTFQNVAYSVLALGDTNYDKFCNCGKIVDKEMERLGGYRGYALACADEATGLEDVVEPWVAGVVESLRSICLRPEGRDSVDVSGEEKKADRTKESGKFTPVPRHGIPKLAEEAMQVRKDAVTQASASQSKRTTARIPSLPSGSTPDLASGQVPSVSASRVPASVGLKSAPSSSTCHIITPEQRVENKSTVSVNNEVSNPSLGVSVVKTIATQCNLGSLPTNDIIDEENLPLLSASKSSCELLTKSASEAYLREQERLATLDGFQDKCNVTVTSGSTAFYYTMYNPFEASIVNARYLTKTALDGARCAADVLGQSLPTSKNGECESVHEEVVEHEMEKMKRIQTAMDRIADCFPLSSASSSLNDEFQGHNNDKRVIELTLSLPDTDKHDHPLEYEPGDAIGVLVPNPHRATMAVLDMMKRVHGVKPDDYLKLEDDDTAGRRGDATELRTVYNVLSNGIDICSPPKKRTLYALSTHTSNASEQHMLRLLSSKSDLGERLYDEFIVKYAVSTYEIITTFFPTCTPTLEILVDILPGITPRYYSVCSSPLERQLLERAGGCSPKDKVGQKRSNILKIALSVVDYCTPSLPVTPVSICGNAIISRERRKGGIASSYFEAVASPFLLLASSDNSSGDVGRMIRKTNTSPTIPIFPKPNAADEFRLPPNVQTPLILIGPGTGIAPFVGFLAHRSFQEKLRKCTIVGNGNDNQGGGVGLVAPGAVESVEGTWRGGYELTEDDIHVGERDAVGLDLAAEFRRKKQNDEAEKATIHGGDAEASMGSIDVFFGCRTPNHDFLYQQEMHEYQEEGILTQLIAAFSRQSTGVKTYVQHRMVEPKTGARIAKLVLEKNATVYICGDGNSMGKEVQDALVDVLTKYGNKEETAKKESSEKFVEKMKVRKKLLIDIWS